MGFALGLGPFGEGFLKRPFGALDPVLTPVGGGVAGQFGLGLPIEFAQQARFPIVPDVGPDGADIDHGEAKQQAQAFR